MKRLKKEIFNENQQLKKTIKQLEVKNREIKEEKRNDKDKIKQLEDDCSFKCKQMQVERLISKYNVPAFLLETQFAKEAIAECDLEKIEGILLHRHNLFYKKSCRLVDGDEE